MRKLIGPADVLLLIGLAVIGYGLYLIYPAATLIFEGAAMVVMSCLIAQASVNKGNNGNIR